MSSVALPPIGSALLLGVVQGLTEFLPISSSGHLAALQLVFPSLAYPGVTLELATHAGTTLAVLLYYRRLLFALVRPSGAADTAGADDDPLLGIPRGRWWWLLFLGTLPTVLIGFLARDTIRAAFDSSVWVAGGLAATGCVLMLSRFEEHGRETPLIAEYDSELEPSLLDLKETKIWTRGGFSLYNLCYGGKR